MILLDDIEEKVYFPLCNIVLDYKDDDKIIRLFNEAEEHWEEYRKNVKLARTDKLPES